MGVYFGTSYLAVLPTQLDNVMLGIADHYPSFENETVYEPVIDERYAAIGKVSVFKTEKEAREAVKRHIFYLTHSDIVTTASAIEESKLELQEYKFELKALDQRCLGEETYRQKTNYYNSQIELTSDFINEQKEQLSKLRKFRSKKITITFASELKHVV